jgi:hypothetical protein
MALDPYLEVRSGVTWLPLESLQEAEDALLGEVHEVGDNRITSPYESCRRLGGTRVVPFSSTHWTDEWGRDVSGLAICGTDLFPNQTVEVGAPTDGRWRSTALEHELFHQLQHCNPTQPRVDGDEAHANWGRDGIWAAIEHLKVDP